MATEKTMQGEISNKRTISTGWLVILPAILFGLAWEPMPFTPLVFVAFAPLLLLAHRGRSMGGWRHFGLVFLSLLLWNITTTWWVWFASEVGAVAMLLMNSFFMYLPFGVWRIWHRLAPRKWQMRLRFDYIFIGIWLLYEFAHHRWDLSWPWLCLGNAFSGMTWYVQWYEYTGTLGGSALILLVNVWVYRAALLLRTGVDRLDEGGLELPGSKAGAGTVVPFWKRSRVKPLLTATICVVFMGLISWLVGTAASRNTNSGKAYWAAAIQPNYDTYEEKFVLDPMQMVREMQATTDSAKRALSSRKQALNCVLWPETSLVSSINVDYMESDQQVAFLKGMRLHDSVKTDYLMGVNMVKWYPWSGKGKPKVVMPDKSERVVAAARQSNDSEYWYTLHNSALWLGDTLAYYHKSKLVPGTEQLPFVSTLPFLESLAISLDENSASGTLGKSDRAMALGEGVKAAPVICYESIYGDYVSDYVGDGAQWLAVVTNDAWWRNTAGHKQHFSYAKLRAIEQRKWVGRAANTGISGFINPKGESVMESVWYQGRSGRCDVPLTDIVNSVAGDKDGGFVVGAGTQLAMVQRIVPNDVKTVYQQLGDAGVLVFLWVMLLVLAFRSREKVNYLTEGAMGVLIETAMASI
jgi:apolipoprotein N-acyltransferase